MNMNKVVLAAFAASSSTYAFTLRRMDGGGAGSSSDPAPVKSKRGSDRGEGQEGGKRARVQALAAANGR